MRYKQVAKKERGSSSSGSSSRKKVEVQASCKKLSWRGTDFRSPTLRDLVSAISVPALVSAAGQPGFDYLLAADFCYSPGWFQLPTALPYATGVALAARTAKDRAEICSAHATCMILSLVSTDGYWLLVGAR